MKRFNNYELQLLNNGEHSLILYLDSLEEFAHEFDKDKKGEEENILIIIKDFIKIYFPDLKVTIVKILIGGTLISSFTLSEVEAQAANYTNYTTYVVKSGDSLWKIANQYNVTLSSIREANNLTTDTIYVGQSLKIPGTIPAESAIKIVINDAEKNFNPPPVIIDGTTYVPVRQLAEALGGSVWYNTESKTVGINRENDKIAFVIGSTTARVNGELIITSASKVIDNTTYVPLRFVSQAFGLNVSWDSSTKTIYISEPKPATYTVKSGDSLWVIAKNLNTTVSELKETNNLTGDIIYIGQELKIPNQGTVNPPATDTSPTISYITHVVEQGDNLWNLSIKYGIPLNELLETNNLNSESTLSVGQRIKVPVHNIPVKPVASERHGELLDWWTEAQYVFPIGKVAKVTDFDTGKSWYVKRTIGANHADSEPLTAEDAAIIKEVWGGSYSWDARAVIVEVDGRRIAASMSSMPHSIQYINDNNYDGHFDIHFFNSTRHSDGEITDSHQEQIRRAAGTGF